MRRLLTFALLMAVGCGPTAPPAGSDPPLPVAEWKTLPPNRKYDPATLERVRNGDPKFASDDGAWDTFMKSTVLPGRKKELPAK